MGWDKRRVVTYIDRGSFPEPITSLASGRIWLREDIETFAAGWRERRAEIAAGARVGRTVTLPHDGDRRLYLIRHGRPDYDSTARPSTPAVSQYDPPLGEVGLEQSELPRRPARAVAADPPPSTPRRWPGPGRPLRSMPTAWASTWSSATICASGSAASGRRRTSRRSSTSTPRRSTCSATRTRRGTWRPGASPGATSSVDVSPAVEDIIATHPSGDVFVVAHGGVINAYFAHILGIRDQDMFFLPENTCLNTVVIGGDERSAWFLSDAAPPHRSRVVRGLVHVRADTGSRRLTGRRLYSPEADRTRGSRHRGREIPVPRMGRSPEDRAQRQRGVREGGRGQNATIQQVITGRRRRDAGTGSASPTPRSTWGSAMPTNPDATITAELRDRGRRWPRASFPR